MNGCIACDLTSGRAALPGGTIARESGWVIEQSVGPLGVGTLIVKPERHVIYEPELIEERAAPMSSVLHRAAGVVTELTNPDQVYISLWSHAGRHPGHTHYVVQSVTRRPWRGTILTTQTPSSDVRPRRAIGFPQHREA